MTATATAEKPAPSFGLAALDNITAAVVFAPGGVDAILAKIDAEARAVRADISTKAGREALGSIAYKVARSKTVLDDMGKEHVADLKKQVGAIDAQRRTLRDTLDTLKAEVRKPLTDWEDAETQRVAGHEEALASLPAMLAHAGDRTPAEIEAQLVELGVIAQRDWQEHEARAIMTIDHVRAGLRRELEAAKKREADAAELARLRQVQAERDKRDYEDGIAKAAADRARADAEASMVAERNRLESERAAAERRAQDAEAFHIAEAEQAERQRLAAIEQAERDRQAAVEAEREIFAANARLEAQQAERRAANKRHAAKINNEVLAALVARGVEADLAKTVIAAIVRDEIPHVEINY